MRTNLKRHKGCDMLTHLAKEGIFNEVSQVRMVAELSNVFPGSCSANRETSTVGRSTVRVSVTWLICAA
jgi:hypothetical protein